MSFIQYLHYITKDCAKFDWIWETLYPPEKSNIGKILMTKVVFVWNRKQMICVIWTVFMYSLEILAKYDQFVFLWRNNIKAWKYFNISYNLTSYNLISLLNSKNTVCFNEENQNIFTEYHNCWLFITHIFVFYFRKYSPKRSKLI